MDRMALSYCVGKYGYVANKSKRKVWMTIMEGRKVA
jgi:hypothetical protein